MTFEEWLKAGQPETNDFIHSDDEKVVIVPRVPNGWLNGVSQAGWYWYMTQTARNADEAERQVPLLVDDLKHSEYAKEILSYLVARRLTE